MFKRILIANRGEIAVRVFRACRELEIEPVVVYSQADREALHVQLAEQAYCIGPARSADSYLNVNAILTVAQAAGCDAIHPGYGFLSENADFADACEAAGITFIGPSGDVIRAMGNKAAARKLMQSAGVPVVPGSDGAVDTAEQAKALADSIGYPVLIKASAGGGGRGMRRVYEPEQLIPLFEEARSESLACFGSGEMYLEKLIVNPRHIEFQIMADGQGHVIQLGDRDCSIQRRNQKLLEESPSKALTPELRERMGAAAVAAEEEKRGERAAGCDGFDWKRDFGNPDEMVDGLGAQRTLEVVSEADAPARRQAGHGSSTDEEFGHREMVISMVVGLVLGVVLFIVAPAAITNLIVGEYDDHTLAWNIVDGLLRVAVFVFYIWLIGRMEDIKRMFMYHGAEHKAIHCFEHGLPMTPENARQFPRLHVRCGTAFLIMVMVIAIFVYTVTPINGLIELWGVPDGAPKLALVILVRILLMPVIAGISYEITVKWAGSNPDNPLVKVVLWPGMQMQYLTTNEPDDGQIECAIAAMQKVLEREEAEEAGEKAAAGAPDNADEPATATA